MSAKLATKDEVVFRTARRVNEALTASIEKRVLVWMAERAPGWVSSDGLTVLGLGAQIGAGICYALARYDRRALLLVIVCVVLNWLGDSLDGTLARVRRQQRPRYGFYVDHMVDVFGSVALMCGLGCSGCCIGRRRLRCWWRFCCSRVRAIWLLIRCRVLSFRRGCLGRRRFVFC